MTEQEFQELLSYGEDTWLDWKEDFPGELIGGSQNPRWDQGRGKLLKDLTAIANREAEGPGYLVYGVEDHGTRREVCGIQASLRRDDAMFQEWVRNSINPPVRFSYSEIEPEPGKKVGIFRVEVSPDYPHVVSASVGGVIHEGQVWFRAGSRNTVALHDDLERMFKGVEPFKIETVDDRELRKIEEHYRAAGFTTALPRMSRKDSLLRQGYKLAYLPGTRREVWVGCVRPTDTYELILMLKPPV